MGQELTSDSRRRSTSYVVAVHGVRDRLDASVRQVHVVGARGVLAVPLFVGAEVGLVVVIVHLVAVLTGQKEKILKYCLCGTMRTRYFAELNLVVSRMIVVSSVVRFMISAPSVRLGWSEFGVRGHDNEEENHGQRTGRKLNPEAQATLSSERCNMPKPYSTGWWSYLTVPSHKMFNIDSFIEVTP